MNPILQQSYKAFQVTRPGVLELVERNRPEPSEHEVLVDVEACGLCGADRTTIEGLDKRITYPRVPGHEIVGRIRAKGRAVSSGWLLGQRVGIGRLGGHCLSCMSCRQGHFNLCEDQPTVGSSIDGGYADCVLVRATALVSIPESLASVDAAPILCAGIASFNGLKRSGARSGDLVAIHGIGGLGHMALQYARSMGFEVAAIGRGEEFAADAIRLGAHWTIRSDQVDPAAFLQSRGGARAIVTTVTDSHAVSALITGLSRRGSLVLLGVGREPLHISPGWLVSGERRVLGVMTGTPRQSEQLLDYSVLTNIRPAIQTWPLDQAPLAYERLRNGQIRYRAVLTSIRAG